MILLEIKEYLKEQKRASLKDVATKFDLTEDVAKEMLAHWERKGKIAQAEKAPCGKKCSCCSSPCGAMYFWKEN
ncbi:MAG: FeoC-like transcriptional regulator [Alphaproteobacteria bacterium]|nr:FeoC-like transcriptional regulator [Alphaproteobacteria bacterium]